MATNCKSLIRKSHFADIYVIYLHFSYLYDNTYLYMHTSYFKKTVYISTYKHRLPFFCFFINNEKIWKFLGKCITILVRVTPYCIYYILQYFCAQLLMYFQVQNFFVREMCQMRSHKEKLYIDWCMYRDAIFLFVMVFSSHTKLFLYVFYQIVIASKVKSQE